MLIFFVLLLRIEEFGMFWAAPQCSTWVTMSRGSTRRSALNYWIGDGSRRDVLEANFTAVLLSG